MADPAPSTAPAAAAAAAGTADASDAVYRLSTTLDGHTQDVRAVAALGADLLATGSRDGTCRVWSRRSAHEFDTHATHPTATHRYVSAVCFLPPSAAHPQGLVAVGGTDPVIAVYDGFADSDAEPRFLLVGHQSNVCALAAAPDGALVSGSWDKSARVWRDGVAVATLEGHEQAVWAVLALAPTEILTASADKTIRLWRDGRAVHTYRGHTDAVRGLAPLLPAAAAPGDPAATHAASARRGGFVSCSNDGSVRVWSLTGDCLQELYGHTSFIYAVCAMPNGDLVSAGEDRSARVWRNGQLLQTLMHPCVSVWCVAATAHGDLVTGGSDGRVRVFSAAPERAAPAAVQAAYTEALASTALPAHQLGDLKDDSIESAERLASPGTRDGQVCMVRRGGPGDAVEAHQWSAAQAQWVKLGDVVNAVASDRRKLHDGQEWDYVFDVDIEDGSPPLKLPYNAAENPWVAAQRFIERHELPASYLDQVADFITKNAQGIGLGSATAPVRDAASAHNPDPFTGAGAYRPGPPPPPSMAPPSTAAQLAAAAGIPQREFSFFRAFNAAPVLAKIKSLAASDAAYALSPQQLDALAAWTGLLTRALTASPSAASASVAALVADPAWAAGRAAAWEIATRWEAMAFPGWDLLRVAALFDGTLACDRVLDALERLPTAPVAQQMLVLRLLSNLLATPAGVDATRARLARLLTAWDPYTQHAVAAGAVANANLMIAWSTGILNLAVLIHQLPEADERSARVAQLAAVIGRTATAPLDPETRLRTWVAIATLADVHAPAVVQALPSWRSLLLTPFSPDTPHRDRLLAVQAWLKRV